MNLTHPGRTADGLGVDPTNGIPVNPTRYSRTKNLTLATAGRVVLTMIAMTVISLGGAIAFGSLAEAARLDSAWGAVLVYAGVLVLSVPVIWALRRFLEGDRAAYLALGWQRGRALSGAVFGLLVSVVLVGVPLWVAMANSQVDYGLFPPQVVAMGALQVFAVSFMLQGFPEEALWRGYLQTTLMSRLTPVSAAVISAVFFGAMHVFSNGGDQPIVDRLIYAFTAVGMGLAMAGLRLVTGSTWAAIAYHTGWHLNTRVPSLFVQGMNGQIPEWYSALTPTLEFLFGIGCLVWWQRTHGSRPGAPEASEAVEETDVAEAASR